MHDDATDPAIPVGLPPEYCCARARCLAGRHGAERCSPHMTRWSGLSSHDGD